MFIVTGETSNPLAMDGRAVATTVESRFCMKRALATISAVARIADGRPRRAGFTPAAEAAGVVVSSGVELVPDLLHRSSAKP
ncbi:MAG TPA: hypothetical protein VL752_18775 [Acidisoma sp.]|nr:hypothetical protein [Acidisoma sp.]HTI02996.1 hypothetical protein [Acidisoma sp.]